MRIPWHGKRLELLTTKDKAKLSCMVREHGKIEALRKVRQWTLLDKATEVAAVEYIKAQ